MGHTWCWRAVIWSISALSYTKQQRLYALRCCFTGDSVEMVHITARQHQMGPISRHAKGNATPNTRAASGDQDDFVVQDAVCKDAHDTTRLVAQDLSRIWHKD